MRKGKKIALKNGKYGALIRQHGSVLTFGRIDKEGNPIMTRGCTPSGFKQKAFIMKKETLRTLLRLGDLEYV